MKKILFLVQLPPPVHGASMVNKAIQNSHIVNSKFKTHYINISPANDLSDIGKFGIRKLLTTFQIFISAVKTFFSFKPDLVYMTLSPYGLALYKDGLLAILIKMLGGSLVYHLHGKGIARYAKSSAWRLHLYRWIFSGANIIHLSEGLFDDIDVVRDKSKLITVIANGVAPLDENSTAPKNDTFTFVYLSNLIRSKGADILVRAAGVIPAEHQDRFQVKIIGKPRDVQYADEIERLIAKSPYKNIKLLGPKYGQEKITELTSSHVFVLPTRYRNECFPLSILEAMAAELAVISTNEGAIPEIIDSGVTGDIIETCTPEELAKVMTKYIESPEYSASCANASKAKFEANYTQAQFEEKLVSTLKNLVS